MSILAVLSTVDIHPVLADPDRFRPPNICGLFILFIMGALLGALLGSRRHNTRNRPESTDGMAATNQGRTDVASPTPQRNDAATPPVRVPGHRVDYRRDNWRP